MYVKAGIAYENGENPVVSDETWDGLSKILLNKYNSLPKWFTKKVSEEDLLTGSAMSFVRNFSE